MQNISAHSHQSFSVRHGLLPALCGMLMPASDQSDAGPPVGCLPLHSCTRALPPPCTYAPVQSCTCPPCTHLPMPHESVCLGSRGSSCQRCCSAVCCLHFSGHGNCCCVMKCCQQPGQEQSFVKEMKNKKSNHGKA